MGLKGELGTMALSDILQWISQGHKTGTLHISRGAVEKRISFASGVIHSSWSNDPRESLGQFLVRERARVVTKQELADYLYPHDEDRDSNVLEVLVGRLRRKLDPDGTLQPIETLRGRGYRFTLQ